MSKKDNTVIDAHTQTMRCEKCGEELPIPLGTMKWAVTVMKAFAEAHAGDEPHARGRTRFSIPAG